MKHCVHEMVALRDLDNIPCMQGSKLYTQNFRKDKILL